ncbi:MAG: 2-C-methyl-D-erythritol 2,4-cyclodiphosphate synthase, partial [Ginsengibacter sp.]
HFPDTDDFYKNIDSKILLKKTDELIKNAGYEIGNIDATICLEHPKIKPYAPQMRKAIASILEIDENAISVKATTSERMGFVGREEGIAAYATVLLMAINK